ncbi:ras and Rab interactor 3-like isoform X2 [Hyperolius riggenbachi]|uniref:ras and Rab interactor 3-like isoform X2 n=1 Tax=Hyperolius riggenbachi TaxID=752182 RepID=UPI0035A2938D
MKLEMTQDNSPRKAFCLIQVTSENGALCIINPLYLHEHGDKWLTHTPHSQESEEENTVSWMSKEAPGKISFQPALQDAFSESSTDASLKLPEASCIVDPELLISQGQLLNQGCKDQSNSDDHSRNSEAFRKSLIHVHKEHKRENKEELNETQGSGDKSKSIWMSREQKYALTPHRVSWIEEHHILEATLKKANSETSLNSSDSFLLPPPPELDSVSISSVEEEEPCSLKSKRKHSHGLGDIVRHSLLAVSTVLTGFVSPEKHVGNRIQQLAEDPSTYLGGTVQKCICNLQKGTVHYLSSIHMLQDIRQLLTSLRNYLLESSEIWEILEHQEIEEFKIASIIETSLYKCVLKPLRSSIYYQLLNMHNSDGSTEKLLDNQKRMNRRTISELKPSMGLIGSGTIQSIQQKLSLMHMAYSPDKKIRYLLKVCKLIYESMEVSSSGKGGYYLTTLFGALYHISSFNTISRQLSAEAQNSIRQWQRRRTIHLKNTSETNTDSKKKMSEKYTPLLAGDEDGIPAFQRTREESKKAV